MSEKIKLTKKIIIDENCQNTKKISINKKEIFLDFYHIKNNFYDPILELLENNGHNADGVLIANVDGVQIIADIIHSILYNNKNAFGDFLGPIEIIEKAVLEEYYDCEEEACEACEEEACEEEACEEEACEEKTAVAEEYDEEIFDEEEDEDEEEEDEEEEDDWNLEEIKECDYYIDNIPQDCMDDD